MLWYDPKGAVQPSLPPSTSTFRVSADTMTPPVPRAAPGTRQPLVQGMRTGRTQSLQLGCGPDAKMQFHPKG